jgi:hypothetical protein
MIYNAKSVFLPVNVHVGLIILDVYFCHSSPSQVEYNCSFTKVDWRAACIALRVVGTVLVVFHRRWRKILHNPPANGMQEPVHEEMFQTLLAN